MFVFVHAYVCICIVREKYVENMDASITQEDAILWYAATGDKMLRYHAHHPYASLSARVLSRL